MSDQNPHLFEITSPGSVSKDAALSQVNRAAAKGIGQIMAEAQTEDLNCMKYVHYMGEYDRILSPFLKHAQDGNPVRLLEIGIQHGGSLRLYERLFGRTLEYTGIDINPKCQLLASQLRKSTEHTNHSVYIGDQSDELLLKRVAKERGPFDIIIDDGSHKSDDVIASFKVLSAIATQAGSVYIVEDVHAQYWNGFRSEKAEALNTVDYFCKLSHALNSEAMSSPRTSARLHDHEKAYAGTQCTFNRIELIQSMIAVHFGERGNLIEWKAGLGSVIS